MGRYIFRRLAHAPGFTAVAVLTLAIGVGANTAIFSVLNGVLLKPLPFDHPDELVGLWHTAAGLNIDKLNMAPANYFVYREQGRAFSDVGLYTGGTVTLTDAGRPEELLSLFVTDGTLPLLRVTPSLGHFFTRDDCVEGSPRKAILSYGFWQQRFGGATSVIGKRIIIDGNAREIIAVLPATFRFRDPAPVILLPLQFNRNKVQLGNFSYNGIARLKPGVTLAAANADIARLQPIWINAFPPPPGFSASLFENAHLGPLVQPFKRDVVGDIGEVLWVLMGTVGGVLLIACANVANLLLVRAEGRQHELAIRAALGAKRSAIALDLLLESLALALAGGIAGVGVAYGTIRLLAAIAPNSLPRIHDISIDPAVLIFALAISLLAGVLFGILPVLKYSGARLNTGLRESGRTLSQSRERHRARAALVIAQVALALVLLIGSGLMIRTFQALRRVQPGFTGPEHILTFSISVPEAQVKEPERTARLDQDILNRIVRVPGVTSAGFASRVPLTGEGSSDILYVEDHPIPEGKLPNIRRYIFISPGYFGAMGIPIVAGRDVTWTDLYSLRNVVLVSENLARETWGDPANAIGKRVRESPKDDWREVVGVAGNTYDDGMNKKPVAIAYWPMLERNFWTEGVFVQRNVTFAIRSDRASAVSFVDEVRQAVWSVNGNLPLARVSTMSEIYGKSMARTSFTLTMLAIAGGMALLLGVIGISGVISYSVSQRRREIGIRMAMGARQNQVSAMFVRHGLALAAIGIVLGLGAAAGLTKLIQSMLFGVSASDPWTFGAVSLCLVVAAVVASYLPARRASSVNPVETLRAE
jgi:predicted permease